MYYNELAMEWTTRIQFPVGIVFFTFVTRSGACATLYSVRKWKGQNVKPTICSWWLLRLKRHGAIPPLPYVP